jgi:hypothetical protein
MKYAKPEVSLVNTAVEAIQAIPKAGSTTPDSTKVVTVGAYEADE